jgi:hypothetical protein
LPKNGILWARSHGLVVKAGVKEGMIIAFERFFDEKC